jgi:hypothetical protein
MNHVEAMKQALEALEDPIAFAKGRAAITALRTAIEQAEKQEPFGYFQYALHFDAWVQNRDSNKGVAFYTTPPAAYPEFDCPRCGHCCSHSSIVSGS